jgi:hypothetical protein
MLRPPKLYTISIPSIIFEKYEETYGLLNRSVRRHYWCLKLRVGESRCNIVYCVESRIVDYSTTAARDFPQPQLWRAYHFWWVMGTFVGYLLDRHSYMHACNDYARYALTDLGIHQSLTNTKETLSKSIQHKQRWVQQVRSPAILTLRRLANRQRS